jgi:hypothetical protein
MYRTYITINGYEFEIKVDYTFYPKVFGSREEGTGMPLEPDEPAQVEINKIEMDFGDQWDIIRLPESVMNDLEEEIIEERH